MSYVVEYSWDGLDLNGESTTFSSIIRFPSYYMFRRSEKIRKNWLKTKYQFKYDNLFEEFVNSGIVFEDINISTCVDIYEE